MRVTKIWVKVSNFTDEEKEEKIEITYEASLDDDSVEEVTKSIIELGRKAIAGKSVDLTTTTNKKKEETKKTNLIDDLFI